MRRRGINIIPIPMIQVIKPIIIRSFSSSNIYQALFL
jgi:hypothetical protein